MADQEDGARWIVDRQPRVLRVLLAMLALGVAVVLAAWLVQLI